MATEAKIAIDLFSATAVTALTVGTKQTLGTGDGTSHPICTTITF